MRVSPNSLHAFSFPLSGQNFRVIRQVDHATCRALRVLGRFEHKKEAPLRHAGIVVSEKLREISTPPPSNDQPYSMAEARHDGRWAIHPLAPGGRIHQAPRQ